MAAQVTLDAVTAAGLLDAIDEQSRAEYPSECCGLIVEDDEGNLVRVPSANLQDKMHALDPERYTRTSTTAYYLDPRLFMENEERLRCIYHSHPDHGAYFSDEDQLVAAPFGEPNLPGVTYLVVSVMDGQVADRKMFRWSDDEEKFVDEAL